MITQEPRDRFIYQRLVEEVDEFWTLVDDIPS